MVRCVAHDEEQRGFFIAKRIQGKFIVAGQFPYLADVKNGEPTAGANQNGF